MSLQKLRQPCKRLGIRIFWIAQILQQLVSVWTNNSQKNIHFFVIVDVIRRNICFKSIGIITKFLGPLVKRTQILPMITAMCTLCLHSGSHPRRQFCILKDFRSEQLGTNRHMCVYQEHIWQLFISPSYIILHHVTNTTQNTTNASAVKPLSWFKSAVLYFRSVPG